jgi:hypothetical protein
MTIIAYLSIVFKFREMLEYPDHFKELASLISVALLVSETIFLGRSLVSVHTQKPPKIEIQNGFVTVSL